MKTRAGIIIIFIALMIGCVNHPVSPFVTKTNNPNPQLKPTIEHKTTQENTLPFSSTATLIPEGSLPLAWEMLNKVSIDSALNDLRHLTGEEPICINNECYTIKNRKTGSEGLIWAKNYVRMELENLDYKVEIIDWSRSGYADQNLITKKSGLLYPEQEIYFVAHLDGIDRLLGERFPAADDNASGVIGLMELARILTDYSFTHTIVLLFSTGEEQGALGVESYLSQLPAAKLMSIQYVVNIDMIGYDANRDRVMELWHGGHVPSIELVNRLSETFQTYQLNLVPRLVEGCG
jgi:hypothetical protein